jgi:hypothetical protein
MELGLLNSRIVQCGLCASDVAVPTAPPAEELEPPDFDTRPGETMRSTLPHWVQRCSTCGYCASDITSMNEEAAGIVQTDRYRSLLQDSSLPAKAREFLCYSLVLDVVDQPGDAGWSALHAAWACDDADDDASAIRCRTLAINLWQKCKQAGESFGDDLTLEFTIVTDVYRRMGAWEEAVVACSEALDTEELTPLFEDILRQEKALIDRKDRSAHSLKELPPFRDRFTMEIQ